MPTRSGKSQLLLTSQVASVALMGAIAALQGWGGMVYVSACPPAGVRGRGTLIAPAPGCATHAVLEVYSMTASMVGIWKLRRMSSREPTVPEEGKDVQEEVGKGRGANATHHKSCTRRQKARAS